MPELDDLASDIRFALTHKSDAEAKKLLRSLPDDALDFLCKRIADHLRLCRWRKEPPILPGKSPTMR
jgi:hypothetical protein